MANVFNKSEIRPYPRPCCGVRAIIADVVLLVVFLLNPFVVIGAGTRGVVLNFGAVQPEVLGEGLHLRARSCSA